MQTLLLHIQRMRLTRAGQIIALVLGLLALLAPSTGTHAYQQSALADLPLAAQSLVSATLGRDDAAYQFQSTNAGYRASNAMHTWQADFSNLGMQIQSQDSRWTFALQSIGYGDALAPVRPVAPTAHANRLDYTHDTFTEWYVNGPAGLEQGWTLTSPPTPLLKGEGNTLTLVLAWEGNARLDASGTAMALLNDDGTVALNYTGLVAYDATGRNLHAWMETVETLNLTSLQIYVDDTDAQYPLTIDPYILRATLRNGFGASNDRLGTSIAMSADGSTIVAGAIGVNSFKGAVYVFAKPTNGWATTLIPTAALSYANSATDDYFGIDVAISTNGSTIVAGASGVNNGKGAAYVFVKPSGGWTTTAAPNAILTNGSGANNSYFGSSVAISGNGSLVVIGAYATNSGKGAAYVFVKPSSGWTTDSTPTAALTYGSGVVGDYFGCDVATDAVGSTIVAGADGVNSGKGAVYVFIQPSGGWISDSTPYAALSDLDSRSGDDLGTSVAISGDGSTIVAGVSGENQNTGAAHVYVKPGGGWATTGFYHARLIENNAHGDYFGSSVATNENGTIIAVGADYANNSNGATYVYNKPGVVWSSLSSANAVLLDPNNGLHDWFGTSVALSPDGSTLVVGANGDNENKGAAYMFNVPSFLYLPFIKK